MWLLLLVGLAAGTTSPEVESTVAHPEGCRNSVCQVHVTTFGEISCLLRLFRALTRPLQSAA